MRALVPKLRKRPLYVATDLIRGISVVGTILILGPGLLLASPLGRSATGKWVSVIILALAVIGVLAAVQRKLRPPGLSLSDEGLLIQGQTGQRTLSWGNLTAVAARNRTTMKNGSIQTIELRFDREPPIYLDDEFTIRREQLLKLIQKYASSSGVAVAFTAENPVAEARFRHTALMAIGIYALSILLVVAVLVGFALLKLHALQEYSVSSRGGYIM